MSESVQNKLIRKRSSKEVTKDKVFETEGSSELDDGPSTTRSTYESFFWFFCYTKMFTLRLAKDLTQSALSYFYSSQVLPDHIVELMKVQEALGEQRESHTLTCSREHRGPPSLRLNLKKYCKTFKSYVLCREDDMGLQYAPVTNKQKQQPFVIVNSSYVSNTSSKELFHINNKKNSTDRNSRKYFTVNVIHSDDDIPSTSKDRNEMSHPQLKESDSQDELQMIDINLHSKNEIPCETDNDSDSIVISYLKNKDVFMDMEGTLLSARKKPLLESVPKMETIMEGEPFTAFKVTSSTTQLPLDKEMQNHSKE